MMDFNRKIRFGVLAESYDLEWWQHETIKSLTDNGIDLVLTEPDIDPGTAASLDFILSFKKGNIGSDIMRSPRFGVWGFCFPGIREFMRKTPKSTVTLCQLNDDKDKTLIIKQLHLNTIFHSYRFHRDRMLKEAAILPLQACKDLIVNGKLETKILQEAITTAPTPSTLQMFACFWICLWRRLVFNVNYLFRQEDWNIGYFTKPDDIHWLKPPKSDYFADPFVIATDKDTYLFFEWFSNKKGKAELAMAKKSENFEVYHKITNFHEHHSYPYVFDYQGQIYCIPEANQTNKVSLYRFLETDGLASLKLDSDLLQGKYVDTTLFIHDNKFYLFTTPQNQPHTHLLIFVADDLRGPYRQHFNNPVKVDCSNSRMAGKIRKIDGDLIRPAQNSTRHYGESITLNKIVQLDEYQYIEETIIEIKPDKKWTYDKGIHTINSDGGITVFDAKRFTFTWRGFVQQIRQKTTKKL